MAFFKPFHPIDFKVAQQSFRITKLSYTFLFYPKKKKSLDKIKICNVRRLLLTPVDRQARYLGKFKH